MRAIAGKYIAVHRGVIEIFRVPVEVGSVR